MELILLPKLHDAVEQFVEKMSDKQAQYPVLGRLGGCVVSLIRGAGCLAQGLLGSIEGVAFACINLLGAAFSKECCLKDAGNSIRVAGACAIFAISSPVLLFLDLIHNVIANKHFSIKNPGN